MKMSRSINTALVAIILSGSIQMAGAATKIAPTCSRQSSPTGITLSEPPKLVLVQADSKTDVARSALRLAFAIENGSPDPHLGVTGNFDGQGLSLGLIQFNLGGSAQRVFKLIPHGVYDRTMPVWGTTFWRSIHAPSSAEAVSESLALQLDRQGQWTLRPDALFELKSFLGTEESREAQNDAAAAEYRNAYSRAVQWAKAINRDTPTPREIATFTDNQVFSGGYLGNVWIEQARAFRDSFPNDGEMVAFVADWLSSCPDRPKTERLWGTAEAKKVAKIWKQKIPSGSHLPDDQALLFAFGFVRALTANGPPSVAGQPDQHGIFKAQVTLRRGLIALGIGTANGISWPGGALD